MAQEVEKRLNGVGMLGRSVTLKLMKRDPSAPVEAPKVMMFASSPVCSILNSPFSSWDTAFVIISTNNCP